MSNKLPPIEVHDLTVAYRKKPVLWDIDFDVPEGKLIAVIGPNGAGKSTLIKTIMGLIEPVSGKILVYGKPVDRERPRIAYVPQRESVDWDFPISVYELVLMGRYSHLKLFRRPGSNDRRIATEALEKVGMSDYAGRQISQLSGGQQQRVFLARALAQQADIYLMDEPLAGVDAATETTIFELLSVLRDEGKTVLVVHHDLQSVSGNFDWVMLLNLRLVAFGPREEVFTTENLQKAYGGRLNILTQVVELAKEKSFVREPGHE
ncbi:MAG: metal ABC transporter ATP-binding protein [Balneolaceae bacterium]|nr:MAG: metal ABC transporter ATP-binding protein [Balneolaceae bacterium]